MSGLCLTLLAALATGSSFSQMMGDYVITVNSDTVFTKVIRMDKTRKYIVCEEKGKKIKYDAKNIRVLKYDTVFYETCRVRLRQRRAKKYCFLQRTIKGKLSLYEITVKRTKFLWGNFGEDLIRLRWAYRAREWRKKNYITVYFYKKESETRDLFSNTWQEKIKDCKLLTKKITSKTMPFELVQLYNENCK